MSKFVTSISAPVIKLNAETTLAFYKANLFHNGEMLSLADTVNSDLIQFLTERINKTFSREIEEIHRSISNRDIGIVAIDIPVVYEDATDDAITGALLAIALTQSILPSVLDVHNKTPFTMFSASQEISEKLNKANLLHISPTDILDFHSDGSIYEKNLSVPTYISIYNIFINYRKRGKFYWIPSSSMVNFNEHVESIGLDEKYSFELTPLIYGDNGTEIKSITQRRALTAVFRRDSNGNVITFMNGRFIGKHEGDDHSKAKLKNFQADILRNEFRYEANQESRRILFVNNAAGFHARDIFEEPISGHEQTRNYLRSVSLSSYPMGEIIEVK